jgi:hypothetical protein
MPDFLTIKTGDFPSRERRFSCCFYTLAGTKTHFILSPENIALEIMRIASTAAGLLSRPHPAT